MLLLDLPELDHTGICHKIVDALAQEGVIQENVKPHILRSD